MYIILILIATIACYAYYHKKNHQGDHHRIAILTPISHGALEEIIKGFKETLSKSLTCTFDVFNAHGDRVMLRTQAEKIIQDSYDLALVVATQPAIIMKEVALQRNSNLPIIGTAVDNPIQNGIIASLASSGSTFTTVTEVFGKNHYQKQLDFFQKLFPNIKRLLLIYCPSPMIDAAKDTLATCCKEHGIELTLAPIFTSAELSHKASVLMPGQDGVIILRDNTVVASIEKLVMLCNHLHLPLYASDLNSLSAGATCAYGLYEYMSLVPQLLIKLM